MPDLQSEPTTRVLCASCGHRRANHRGPVGPNGERGQCMVAKDGQGCGCTAFEHDNSEVPNG